MEKYKQLIAKAKKPLTDKEYLDTYISDIYLFKPHEACAIKDTYSVHLGITQNCAQLYGLNAPDILNATYYDMLGAIPNINESHVDVFHQQDRHVEQTRTQIKLLHVNEYFTTGLPLRSCHRTAIANPATNNVLGTLVHITKPEINIGLEVILELHGHKFGKCHSMDILSNPDKFELTEIERDVLFCVCLGISHRKDVANFLTVVYKHIINAETTIHDAFRRLYRKLNGKFKSETQHIFLKS